MFKMTQQGAALQTYNNELVKCLEELCERRNALQREINREEREKQALEDRAAEVASQLAEVDASLQAKLEARERYDRTISESEQAYVKILESSQVLLNVVRKDARALMAETDPCGSGSGEAEKKKKKAGDAAAAAAAAPVAR